jgi:ribosomal protein L36
LDVEIVPYIRSFKTIETSQHKLCNDCKIGKYTRATSEQWLSKHVPAATDTNATMVQQPRNGVFYVVCAKML